MVLEDADKELRAELIDHDNYGYYLKVVSDSVVDLPNVLPESYPGIKDQLEGTWGIDNLTHCTTANYFSNAGTREKWDQDDQDWWFYTCCVPLYPYVTNFIEDGLLGMRLVSWMQYVYDIAGYLNWSICVYDENANPYEDANRGGSNAGFIAGDGYMFYPGAPYGIYGPVASLRAVAYRDGTEDYDLMRLLEDEYAEMGLDAQLAIEGLFNVVCSGTIPTMDVDLYYATKKELVNLLVGLSDEYGVVYGKTTTQFGMATVEVAPTNENAEIYVDGVKQTPNDSGLFELSVNLTKTNELTFTVKTENGEKVVSRKVGNTYQYLSGFEDGDSSFIGVNNQSAISLNTDANYVIGGGKSVKINLNGLADKAHTPYISFNAEFLKKVDIQKLYDLEFEVYNASDAEITFKFQGFTGSRYRDYATVVLKPGWNSVKINGICSQTEIELVKGFYMTTENFYVEGGVDLYIDEIYYSVQ